MSFSKELEKSDLDLEKGKLVEVWCDKTKPSWDNVTIYCGYWTTGIISSVDKDVVTVDLIDQDGNLKHKTTRTEASPAYIRTLP